ncbi:MAG: exodeoxyribonuclease VII large subunit [Proteobacteria bacterium]|nr:exodeoxyribonuclease VII large subunit [Pseudomonadota bacterium]
MQNIPEFSVSEITNLTKSILEENFGLIRVRGEISKVKDFKGHYYFSLKDENFVLNAVCWARNVELLNIKPEEGMEVFAQGKITTYAKGSISNYQLQVDQIDIHGEGALLKIFEKRKKKLKEEGLFDEKHKQPLPFLPDKIGIVTSPTGSVIMDIIDRVKKRFPTNLEIFPITVQGTRSAQEIISGIEFFNLKSKVDLIIIARGGGGAEDFLPFNDEEVVRTVFRSKVPIISAIGHETDFTLLDFVADVRAATPTAAAEMAVPEIKNLNRQIIELFKNLKFTIELVFNKANEELNNISKYLNTNSLKNFIKQNNSNLISLSKSLNYFVKSSLKEKNTKVENYFMRIDNLSIQKVLKRGFAIIKDTKEKKLMKLKNLNKDHLIDIEFYDGVMLAKTIKKQ